MMCPLRRPVAVVTSSTSSGLECAVCGRVCGNMGSLTNHMRTCKPKGPPSPPANEATAIVPIRTTSPEAVAAVAASAVPEEKDVLDDARAIVVIMESKLMDERRAIFRSEKARLEQAIDDMDDKDAFDEAWEAAKKLSKERVPFTAQCAELMQGMERVEAARKVCTSSNAKLDDDLIFFHSKMSDERLIELTSMAEEVMESRKEVASQEAFLRCLVDAYNERRFGGQSSSSS